MKTEGMQHGIDSFDLNLEGAVEGSVNKGETLFQLIKRVPDAIHGLSNVNLRKLKEFFESKSLEKNDDCRSIYDQICLLVKDENKKLGSCRTTIYTVSARVGDILSPEEIAELRGSLSGKNHSHLSQAFEKAIQDMFQGYMFSGKSSLAQQGFNVSTALKGDQSIDLANPQEIEHIEISYYAMVTYWEKQFGGAEHDQAIDFASQLQSMVQNGNELGRMKYLGEPASGLEDLIADDGEYGEGAESDYQIYIGDKEADIHHKYFVSSGGGGIRVSMAPSPSEEKEKMTYYPLTGSSVEAGVQGDRGAQSLGRESAETEVTSVLEPGETIISQIPMDIGPYNANLRVQCVDQNGANIPGVYHRSATILDKVRTYNGSKSNYMQVEVTNSSQERVSIQDIYFNLDFYVPPNFEQEKENWELRNDIIDHGMTHVCLPPDSSKIPRVQDFLVNLIEHAQGIEQNGTPYAVASNTGLSLVMNQDNLFYGPAELYSVQNQSWDNNLIPGTIRNNQQSAINAGFNECLNNLARGYSVLREKTATGFLAPKDGSFPFVDSLGENEKSGTALTQFKKMVIDHKVRNVVYLGPGSHIPDNIVSYCNQEFIELSVFPDESGEFDCIAGR